MWEILETYTGVIADALTVGALLGVVGGIVLMTAADASQRLNAITLGTFVGGFGMLFYQLLRLDSIVHWRAAGFSTALKQLLYSQGGLFWDAFLRVVQAAFLGGVVMLIFLAPGRALKGALLGFAIGVASALIVWGVLQLVGAPAFPQIFFALLVAGVFLFLFDILPLRA